MRLTRYVGAKTDVRPHQINQADNKQTDFHEPPMHNQTERSFGADLCASRVTSELKSIFSKSTRRINRPTFIFWFLLAPDLPRKGTKAGKFVKGQIHYFSGLVTFDAHFVSRLSSRPGAFAVRFGSVSGARGRRERELGHETEA